MVMTHRAYPFIWLLASCLLLSGAYHHLSASGLVRDTPATVRELVPLTQDYVRYGGKDSPPRGWETTDFDDSTWLESPGIVAFLRNPDALRRVPGISWETALDEDSGTVYLRTTFEAPADISPDAQLILDYFIKDGAVLYLNGMEVGRTASMPQKEPVTHDTQAVVAPRMMLHTGFFIDASLLRPGRNVLALSLHRFDDEENTPDRIAAVRLNLTENWETRPLTTRPKHQRVLWITHPQREAMVSWTTSAKSRENILYFDTEPRGGRVSAYRYTQSATRSGQFAMSSEDVEFGTRPGHFHHVHLQDLQPDTTYYMVMSSDGEASREFYFRTAPDVDRPFKLLFGGDSRIGGGTPYFHHDRRAVNRRMVALLEEHPDILAFIHGGDYTQRAQWRYFHPWLTDHELTITQDGRILPILVARGNHDMDIGFEEVFWWPGQENRYYYHTMLTPGFSLITLNSEISHGGMQRRFLREALSQARPNRRWVVTSYHKPAWPSVRGFESGADRRRFWVPLFDEYKVDLSLESHDHALKRTVPILHGEEHPDGIIYIGDGGLGVPQRNPDPSRWYLQNSGMTKSTHHVHLLEVEEETIRGIAYNIGGQIVDEFVIRRRDPENGFMRMTVPLVEATEVAE